MSLKEFQRRASEVYSLMKQRYPSVKWEAEHFMLDLVEKSVSFQTPCSLKEVTSSFQGKNPLSRMRFLMFFLTFFCLQNL